MESTRGRNLKIVLMVRAGKSYPKIGKELGISAARVGQIFRRHQELVAYAHSPFGSLDVKAYNVLRHFFERKLAVWPSCGEHILSQIKAFMRENGML